MTTTYASSQSASIFTRKNISAFWCLGLKSSPQQTEMISKIDCPVLVALGDKDFAGPATQLLDALPNSHYLELRGVDHFATPKDFSFIDETLKFLDAEPQW